MTIQSILNGKSSHLATIAPMATVKQAADEMRRAGIAALAVREEERVIGIISEREIVLAISHFGAEALTLPVATIARQPVTVAPRDSVKHAMTLMTRQRTRHLLVVESGQSPAIVSIGDVVKSRLEDLELEAGVLRDGYLAARSAIAA